MRICNFGSLNIDKVYRVERFVRAGETVRASSFAQHPGGKGLNQSVALARAGAEVFHAGCAGPDGGFLAGYLEKCGVDLSCLRYVDVPTGHAVIQVDDGGQNCILINGGANLCVTAEQVNETLARFGAGDLLLLQNEISAITRLILTAKERGMTVVLNPSPVTEELLEAPLGLVDLFILNETEGFALSGSEDPDGIAAALAAKYPASSFLLTLGENGAVYYGGGERIAVPAVKVEAVDTTAAGDTFTGYFIAEITRGKPVAQALSTAAAAAAIAVTRPGAADSIPTIDDINRAFGA